MVVTCGVRELLPETMVPPLAVVQAKVAPVGKTVPASVRVSVSQSSIPGIWISVTGGVMLPKTVVVSNVLQLFVLFNTVRMYKPGAPAMAFSWFCPEVKLPLGVLQA